MKGNSGYMSVYTFFYCCCSNICIISSLTQHTYTHTHAHKHTHTHTHTLLPIYTHTHTCLTIDFNECDDPVYNPCDHHCHNTAGSFTCSCRDGWYLDADGRRCFGMTHTHCLLKVQQQQVVPHDKSGHPLAVADSRLPINTVEITFLP